MPAREVIEDVVLVEGPDDATQTPVVRRAEAQLVLDMLVAFDRPPIARRRVALRVGDRVVTAAPGAIALVVVRIHAARVVRVVTRLLDVAGEIAAGVHRLDVAELAVDGPRGALEAVLVVGRVEERHLQRRERGTVGRQRLLVEHPRRIHRLVRLRDEHVPVVVDLRQQLHARADVGHRVDRTRRDRVVVQDLATRRNAVAGVDLVVGADAIDGRVIRVVDTDVGVLARERRRNVVDVAATVIVVDDRAQRHRVGDEGQVEDRLHVGVRVTVGRDAVAGLERALRLVELGLVRDVPDHAGLGTGAEQRALRPLEHLDAVEIGRIDVEVAVRHLSALVVQINRDIRPKTGRGTTLARLRAGREAAHEDFALPRSAARARDVRQELDVIVEGRDVELGQRLRRERLDGDGDVLDVLAASLGGDDDLIETAGVGCRGREGRSAENGADREGQGFALHRHLRCFSQTRGRRPYPCGRPQPLARHHTQAPGPSRGHGESGCPRGSRP